MVYSIFFICTRAPLTERTCPRFIGTTWGFEPRITQSDAQTARHNKISWNLGWQPHAPAIFHRAQRCIFPDPLNIPPMHHNQLDHTSVHVPILGQVQIPACTYLSRWLLLSGGRPRTLIFIFPQENRPLGKPSHEGPLFPLSSVGIPGARSFLVLIFAATSVWCIHAYLFRVYLHTPVGCTRWCVVFIPFCSVGCRPRWIVANLPFVFVSRTNL